MLMDNSYQIWEACTKDDMRPSLTCVNIMRQEDVEGVALPPFTNGVAVATDGSMLAVVPVDLEDEDVAGLVPADILKQAWRESKKFKNIYADKTFIRLGEERVTIPFQVEMPRGILDMGSYPDFMPIVPKKVPQTGEDKKPRSDIALDMSLLLRLGKALGRPPHASKESHAVISFNGAAADPYYVSPGRGKDKEITAPFGLLMPIHFYGSDE